MSLIQIGEDEAVTWKGQKSRDLNDLEISEIHMLLVLTQLITGTTFLGPINNMKDIIHYIRSTVPIQLEIEAKLDVASKKQVCDDTWKSVQKIKADINNCNSKLVQSLSCMQDMYHSIIRAEAQIRVCSMSIEKNNPATVHDDKSRLQQTYSEKVKQLSEQQAKHRVCEGTLCEHHEKKRKLMQDLHFLQNLVIEDYNEKIQEKIEKDEAQGQKK